MHSSKGEMRRCRFFLTSRWQYTILNLNKSQSTNGWHSCCCIFFYNVSTFMMFPKIQHFNVSCILNLSYSTPLRRVCLVSWKACFFFWACVFSSLSLKPLENERNHFLLSRCDCVTIAVNHKVLPCLMLQFFRFNFFVQHMFRLCCVCYERGPLVVP